MMSLRENLAGKGKDNLNMMTNLSTHSPNKLID